MLVDVVKDVAPMMMATATLNNEMEAEPRSLATRAALLRVKAPTTRE